MKRTLVLVRHGETAWNREGRFQGHTDIALSEIGRAQARALRTRLEASHPHLYDDRSATLVRTHKAAGLTGIEAFHGAYDPRERSHVVSCGSISKSRYRAAGT